MNQPTQVRRPWRATARTIVQFVLAAAVLLPFVVAETGLDPEVYPWLGGLLAVAAAVTRIMALPQVEAFLRRFAPFLAADPAAARHRGEAGRVEPLPLLLVALVVIALLVLLTRI